MSKMEAIWYNIGKSGTKEDKFQVRNRMVYVKNTGGVTKRNKNTRNGRRINEEKQKVRELKGRIKL